MKSPSIDGSAFSCPHCGAYTSQHWYAARLEKLEDGKTPHFPSESFIKSVEEDPDLVPQVKREVVTWAKKMRERELFLSPQEGKAYVARDLCNLNLSECYVCHKYSVWLADRLLHPSKTVGPLPNPDLPANVIGLFEEARRIANESPRGAAALLRLCIQHLCTHLGETGRTIDENIKNLVSKGLNPTVQRSLDIVRVIGNESVHPGSIDLNDDRDTAVSLFELVNAIADQMISHPKKVDALYGKLPASKREAIAKRDAPRP